MNNWVLVADSDPLSTHQIEVCKALRPPIAGAILCSDVDNRDAPVCYEVSHFPAFCHKETRECRYGLRATQADLDELKKP